MAILIQKSAGNISALKSGNEFYENCYANNTYPNNSGGSNVGYRQLSTTDRNIHFTPTKAGNFKGVILSLYNTHYNSGAGTARYRDIRVRLQENTGSWVTRLEQTFSTNDFIPDNQWAYCRGLIDCRFTSTYAITTAASTWRIVVDYVSGGSGTFYLNYAQDGSSDNNLFMILYIDSTVTLTSSDTLVITDRITLDQNLTLDREDADHGTNSGLDYMCRYYSIWGCMPNVKTGSETNPQLYIPSTVGGNYKLDVKGCIYMSGYQPKLVLAGEDANNPIPYNWGNRADASNRTFEIEFSEMTSGVNEPGFVSGAVLQWRYGKLAGIELWGKKPPQMWGVLKSNCLASQAVATIIGDMTDSWAVGDHIMCGGSKYSSTRHYRDYAYNEIREIQSITYNAGTDDTTVTFTTNLTRNHYYYADMPTYYTLKERNIIVGGQDTTYTAESYWSFQNGALKMQGVLLHDVQYIYARYSYLKYMSAQQQIDSKWLIDGCNIHDCYRPFYMHYWQTSVEMKNNTSSSDLTGTTMRCDRFLYLVYGKNAHVHDNVLVGRFVYGPSLAGSSDCVIEDNYLNIQYGIYLSSGAAKNTIKNNKFSQCQTGVYFAGANFNTFIGNTFRRIYYDENYGAASESTHGCYFFATLYNNLQNVSYNDDADCGYAFVVCQNDAGATHVFDNAKLGTDWKDDVVNEGGATYRTGWNAGTELRFQKWNEGTTDFRDFFTNANMVSDTTELYGNDVLTHRFQPYPGISEDGEVDFVKKIFVEQDVTIRGYLKKNVTYTGETPKVEIIGDTTDSFTMADDETWQSFSIGVTTDSKGEVCFRITLPQTTTDNCYLWLGTVYLDCMGTSYLLFGHDDYWFDGLPEYKIDPIESDNYIVATEVVALAYTGIDVNNTTGIITISEDHTLQEIYDYIKYFTADDAELLYPGVISTTDGIGYSNLYDFIINDGITVTATDKKLTMVTGKTYTLTGTGNFTGIIADSSKTRVPLVLNGVIDGSRYRVETQADGSKIADGTQSGSGDITNYYEHTVDVDIVIRVRKSSSGTKYLPYTAGGTIQDIKFALTISQTVDNIVA